MRPSRSSLKRCRGLASVTAVAAAASLFARSRFVDLERSALEVLTIDCCDRRLCFAVVFHFYETEAPRSTGFPIRDHLGAGNPAMVLEQCQQVVGSRFPDKVADIDIRRHQIKDLSVPKSIQAEARHLLRGQAADVAARVPGTWAALGNPSVNQTALQLCQPPPIDWDNIRLGLVN